MSINMSMPSVCASDLDRSSRRDVAARCTRRCPHVSARRPAARPRPDAVARDPIRMQRRPRLARLAARAYPPREAMADTGKIAKNLERFAQAVAAHDRENPTHTAYGIGLAHFDMERLGFEEGEEILPGITIHADGGVTGNFRVLCDGEHDEERERGRGGGRRGDRHASAPGDRPGTRNPSEQ